MQTQGPEGSGAISANVRFHLAKGLGEAAPRGRDALPLLSFYEGLRSTHASSIMNTCDLPNDCRNALPGPRRKRFPEDGARCRMTIRMEARRALAFTVLEMLVVAALVALLASLLLPSLGRARTQASNAACVNNLRQLGTAVRVYADDHEDRLPSAEILPTQPIDPGNPLPRICDVLAGYVGRGVGTNAHGATVFRCLLDRRGRFAAEGSSYEWNAELNGRRIDETRTDGAFLLLERGNPAGGVTNFVLTLPPSTTPLFLDYDDVHPRARRSGKNVVFMDGHVAPL